MMSRLYQTSLLAAVALVALNANAFAQSGFNDTRQEYVRSSSPTKSGGRVISESVAGRKMVRIARAPSSSTIARRPSDFLDSKRESTVDVQSSGSAGSKYKYPEAADDDDEQVTAFRQTANQPPQLRFPQQNRFAQCNCNGVPVPPQQLQFMPQNNGFAGFQGQQQFPQQGFQPQGLQPAGVPGYPLQSGIGVPQFNQTGGNWWTPFLSGSGYYTPLLNFRNMPQGTYLGQGIIGQPTAYVDGQPLRNLLRYVSP